MKNSEAWELESKQAGQREFGKALVPNQYGATSARADGRGVLYPTIEDKYQGGEKESLNNYMPNDIRLHFIRKVYGILSVMILLTIGCALPFRMVPFLVDFVAGNWWLLYIVMALNLLIMAVLQCVPKAAQSFPANFFLLLGFVITQSLMLGIFTAQYETDYLLFVAGITGSVVILLTLYAFYSKADFTGILPFLVAGLLGAMGIGVLSFVLQLKLLFSLWLGLGVFFYSFFLIHDTQLIVGGKHKQFKFTEDDYVLGSLCLYTDILNLFLLLLSLLSLAHDDYD
eukprot:gnl/TRDRNA2_/TRDRNA2_182151_c0_seq1.p1 gnl/TRDRNA2_/TRDRNA2_182151_c0~~gnl/TRDRNA2_/TRDRNA2_182151_c0_seq1.p1  ORF type:complete len:285 (+),score=50.47 gnl/TRDRNA2_/TRDRNA2_182151_c0_seq1:127-981(+)